MQQLRDKVCVITGGKRAGAAMSSLETLTERWFTNHPLQLSARDVVTELLSHETRRDFFAV